MMTLTKAELADLLFERVGLNKREAKDMVERFFEEIRLALAAGNSVKLSGFGNFQLRELLLPIPEHVRLDRTQFAHLANREIALGGNGREVGVSSVGFRHGSRLRPWPSISGWHGRSLRDGP